MPRQMTEAQLRRVVEANIVDSTWYDDSETQDNYRKALDSYYGRNKPKTTDGRSGAVSQDVASMVEAVVSQMMPAFDFDEVAVFDPQHAGDSDQVRLESRVCNVYLRDKNEGYSVVQEALRNALLLRNGILKVWTERITDRKTRSFEGLNSLELDAELTPTAPDQQIEIVGDPTVNDDDTVDITIKRTTVLKRLSIDSTDPTMFLVPKNYWSVNLSECPFVGERYFLSLSDLRGLDVPESQLKKLTTTDSDTTTAVNARNRNEQVNWLDDHGDPAMRRVEIFELYIQVDFDGDGIAERRRILYAGGVSGGQVVKNEPWPAQPYASGTGFIQAQRWLGMSLYDKLIEIENQKTEALRQYIDNLSYMNNAEVVAVEGAANIEDLKARRPGGINRVDNIEAVRELATQSNGAESQSFLNYADKIRSEMGGASLDLQNAELQLAGDTAHGIERQYTSKEQLAQLMTRSLAETLIRQTFFLIHETLRRDFPDQAQVQLGSQFIAYEPGRWPYRDQLTIVAGMSVSERLERKSLLEQVVLQQEKLFQAGLAEGILVDLNTYHSTLLDWVSSGGVQNARRYWIDPRSETSLQAQQQAQQRSQQAQQAETALSDKLFDTQVKIESDKNITSLLESAGQLQFDYWKGTLDSELKEQQLDAQHDTDDGDPEQVEALQAVGAVAAVS